MTLMPFAIRDSMRALRGQLPVRGFRCGTLVVLLACLGLLVGATSASASKPVIVSLSVTPKVLPSSGGEFTLTARVRNAVSCTIYTSGLGSPRTVNCSSGRVTYRRHAPANTSTLPYLWGGYIEAHSGRQNTRSHDADVEVPPSAAAAPPIRGLDACTPGPECDYGTAADESFQTWGNVAPNTLGDCTFAAAANWEQILFGAHADPTVLGYEFAQAGGTEQGLAQNSLWTYWRKDGIAGVYLTGLHRYTTEQADVENGVRDYSAMIGELDFTENDGFGEYSVGAGTHDVVVDGFTPGGPLVVTWGETLQMTWEQWDDEAVGMWGIGAT
jgi:hypothetical protein